MILDHDRSYYIGASDTNYVIGNYETSSFAKWYGVKQGIYDMNFSNDAMKAGTAYEHRILESLNINSLEMDNQRILGRLRVNLDGNTSDTIYEVKTYKYDKKFKVSKQYRNQVNVEMFAYNIRNAFIVSYELTDVEYKNYFCDIDQSRINFEKIEYDGSFINDIYIPHFNYISYCLDNGLFPKNNKYEEFIKNRRNLEWVLDKENMHMFGN